MPLSSETIRNSPLSGPELLECILRDTRELLARDGMFAPYVGYGRVGYVIQVELEMDNLTYPKHLTKRVGGAGVPLPDPGEDAAALGLARSRQVISPNATRVLNDLPIKTVSVAEGQIVEHEVQGYDKGDIPPQPEPIDSDWSEAATAAIKLRGKGKT
ncbi:MAG: hypothetical protein ABH877_03400 [bacterium]